MPERAEGKEDYDGSADLVPAQPLGRRLRAPIVYDARIKRYNRIGEIAQ